jgi:hypothetical protein
VPVRDGAEEVSMGRLRDCWLEALATCVTALLLGVIYGVLANYAAGPALGAKPHPAFHDFGQSRGAVTSARR